MWRAVFGWRSLNVPANSQSNFSGLRVKDDMGCASNTGLNSRCIDGLEVHAGRVPEPYTGAIRSHSFTHLHTICHHYCLSLRTVLAIQRRIPLAVFEQDGWFRKLHGICGWKIDWHLNGWQPRMHFGWCFFEIQDRDYAAVCPPRPWCKNGELTSILA